MTGSSVILLCTYLSLAIFFIATGKRVAGYLKLPKHLRWELYPVKHEVGKKADYGGSYLEESNWWEKKRKSSLFNEMKFMIPEILFIKGLYDENRKLWWVSFPFHFGLYLLLGTFGLMVLSALFMIFGTQVGPEAGSVGIILHYLTIALGYLGLTMGTFGAAGLLYMRLADEDLRAYSSIVDKLNLVLFLIFFIVALFTWLFFDPGFTGARTYVFSILTFSILDVKVETVFGALTILLASFIMAYIPLTHMSHMFMKYFMYHDIRWEDEPNLKGSEVEKEVLKNLERKPTWAAPHIKAEDGTRTWAEVATTLPDFGDKK